MNDRKKEIKIHGVGRRIVRILCFVMVCFVMGFGHMAYGIKVAAQTVEAVDVEAAGQEENPNKTETRNDVMTEVEDEVADTAEKGLGDTAKDEQSSAIDFETTTEEKIEVKISAPEGAFPEGTNVEIRDVSEKEEKDFLAAIKALKGIEVRDFKAVNISFVKDKKKIEPLEGEKVSVTLNLKEKLKGKKKIVAHLNETGKVELINDSEVRATDEEVLFAATEFSPYAIIGVDDDNVSGASGFRSVAGLVDTTLEYGYLNSDGVTINDPEVGTVDSSFVVDRAQKLIKLTIDVHRTYGGDRVDNRDVKITIPRGLQLVNATGIASVNKGNTNGRYNRADYTPTEALYLTDYTGNTVQYPTWQAETWLYDTTLANNFDTVNTSGALTYSFSNSATDGTVTVFLRANPYFAQPSSNGPSVDTALKNIQIEVTGVKSNGDPVSDTASYTPILRSSTDWVHYYGINSNSSTYYEDATATYNLTLNPVAQYQKNLFGLSVNNAISVNHIRAEVIYPTGAVFTPPSGWTVMSTSADAANTTVQLTRDDQRTWIMTGNSTVATFSVQYPADLFPAGSRPVVRVANMEYDELRYDKETDSFYTEKKGGREGGANRQVSIIIIPDESDYRVSYGNQLADREEFNDYGSALKVLSQVRRYINHPLPNNPVRLRCDVDTTNNNVSKIVFNAPAVAPYTYPTAKGAKITKVVVKYEGEAETVIYENPSGWSGQYGSGSGGYYGRYGYVPVTDGSTVYMGWKGAPIDGSDYGKYGSTGSHVQLTAPSGKTYEYAYVEFDSDNTYSTQMASQTLGRPKNDAYTGIYSRDQFSSWHQNNAGEWVRDASWQSTGFRWKEPEPPELTITTTDLNALRYEYNHTKGGYNYPLLGCVDIQNASGTKIDHAITLSVQIDPKDAVRRITIPYTYDADASVAAQQIQSIQYKLQNDPETYTWRKESGEPMPFSPGTNAATIEGPNDGLFESFEVVLEGWGTSEVTSRLGLYGYLTNESPDNTKSHHQITISYSGTADPDWTGETGVAFYDTASSSADPITSTTEVNAGSIGTMNATIRGNLYTAHTFAIVLPKGITLENMYANGWRNNPSGTGALTYQSLGSDDDGRSMRYVSERAASSEEVQRIFGTDHPDVTEATVYYYDLYDQGAWLRSENRNSGSYGYRNFVNGYDVHAVIKVSPLFEDTLFTMDKILYVGTNLENVNLSSCTLNGPLSSDGTQKLVDNFLNLGESAKIVTGHSESFLKINKYPALIVEEAVANASGTFKYYDGSPESIVKFGPNEEGKLQIRLSNTVNLNETVWPEVENYVFVPIPNRSAGALSTEHNVDLKVTGPLSVLPGAAGGEYGNATYEVRYLRDVTFDDVDLTNVVQWYNAGEAYDATHAGTYNVAVLKVKGLAPDGTMKLEWPFQAPDYIEQQEKYNQMNVQSAYAFNGSVEDGFSYASYKCKDWNNSLRVSYRYPEWTVRFENYVVDSDGRTIASSQPAIASIDHVRNEDPILKKDVQDETHPDFKTLDSDPDLNGHRFGGYFMDKQMTIPFIPYDGTNLENATKITNDTTIYVKWEPEDFKVKYDVNGGKAGSGPGKVGIPPSTMGTDTDDQAHYENLDGQYTIWQSEMDDNTYPSTVVTTVGKVHTGYTAQNPVHDTATLTGADGKDRTWEIVFVGWTTDKSAVQNADGSEKIFDPHDVLGKGADALPSAQTVLTLPAHPTATGDPDATVYAIWKIKEGGEIIDAGTRVSLPAMTYGMGIVFLSLMVCIAIFVRYHSRLVDKLK